MNNTGIYVTTYCNFAHRLSDGKPVEHECGIIPPLALRAEMAGDYKLAQELIDQGKTSLYFGERTLPRMKRGVKLAKLKTETNTATMQRKVLAAYRLWSGKLLQRGLSATFEHDHWWITAPNGAQYSVVDATGPGTVDGFDFEEVTPAQE